MLKHRVRVEFVSTVFDARKQHMFAVLCLRKIYTLNGNSVHCMCIAELNPLPGGHTRRSHHFLRQAHHEDH